MTAHELHITRLLLRPVTPAIIHDVFRSKTRNEIVKEFGLDEQGFELYRQMHERGMETFRISHFFFLLIEKKSGQPIGECGFHTWNPTHRRAELFYALRNDEHKRKGYMSEALPAVINYGFTELNLHRIQAMVDGDNVPSVRLLVKSGFTREGVVREDYCVNGKNEDSDCYSLLRSEWQQDKL